MSPSTLLLSSPPEQIGALESFELNLNEELKTMANADESLHEPITDGVVDIPRYLGSSPKILWILKEPWEDLNEGESGGGWSLTELAKELVSNRDSFAIMAYVTYSVFHGFPIYDAVPYVTDSPEVAKALRNIAYINVSKLPGKSTSSGELIRVAYNRNRDILARQIKAMAPDVIIGGGTLNLFFQDLHLRDDMFSKSTSAWSCSRDGCLYIWAYNPNQRTVRKADYCDDIVNAIKSHFPVPRAAA